MVSRVHRSQRITSALPSVDHSSNTRADTSFVSHRHLDRQDKFCFPRPDDEDIERLFQDVSATLRLGRQELAIDAKWDLVHRHKYVEWLGRRRTEKLERAATIVEGTPKFYIKKLKDETITAKQVSGLHVSLRAKEVGWLRQFISMQGASLLAQALSHVDRRSSGRRQSDVELEWEIVKCLRQIFNNSSAIPQALDDFHIVPQIVSALSTPSIRTRKLILDILAGIAFWDDFAELEMVLKSLTQLSKANNPDNEATPYAYWFKSMEMSLISHLRSGGRADRLSTERKIAADQDMSEYAIGNLLLINAILSGIADVDLSRQNLSQMEAAGLRRIMGLCEEFDVPSIHTQLQQLRARIDEEVSPDMDDIVDVFNVLLAKRQDNASKQHLLSILHNLTLIRDDGPRRTQCYKLLDSLVGDVVSNAMWSEP